MLFSELEKITGGRILRLENDNEVSKFRIDSRKATKLKSDVFIAVKGTRNDGHDFIPELELENFIIEDPKKAPHHGNVILVESGIDCLQAIARYHRSNFNYPVLAITGSNAKTTIKEWLFEIVTQEFKSNFNDSLKSQETSWKKKSIVAIFSPSNVFTQCMQFLQ